MVIAGYLFAKHAAANRESKVARERTILAERTANLEHAVQLHRQRGNHALAASFQRELDEANRS